jgi:hypothetical protein
MKGKEGERSHSRRGSVLDTCQGRVVYDGRGEIAWSHKAKKAKREFCQSRLRGCGSRGKDGMRT